MRRSKKKLKEPGAVVKTELLEKGVYDPFKNVAMDFIRAHEREKMWLRMASGGSDASARFCRVRVVGYFNNMKNTGERIAVRLLLTPKTDKGEPFLSHLTFSKIVGKDMVSTHVVDVKKGDRLAVAKLALYSDAEYVKYLDKELDDAVNMSNNCKQQLERSDRKADRIRATLARISKKNEKK